MAPDDRDAFGDPTDEAQAPALIPNLGRFAEPVSPTPAAEHPVAPAAAATPSGGSLPALPATAPGATAALIIGVFGLILLLPAPFAWWRGHAMLREIDASAGRLGGRSEARAAQILGILGTLLLVTSLIGEISVLAGQGG